MLTTMERPLDRPVTLGALRRMAREGRKIAVLTCYDATTARWLERSGVECLLVGDTAAEMILGFDGTIHAPLDFMILLTAAVKRGAPRCHVMADMPFMSYQADDAEAIRNAGRFMTEGKADSVKLELVADHAPLVRKLSNSGVPVVAHIGLHCQRIAATGNYLPGATAASAQALVETAERLTEAGAVMLLIEKCPAEVSHRIVDRVSIPVIGCGGGPACHGHVVVLHDLLGLSGWQPPFAPPMGELGESVTRIAQQWVQQVHKGEYLKDNHPYRMADGEAERFAGSDGQANGR